MKPYAAAVPLYKEIHQRNLVKGLDGPIKPKITSLRFKINLNYSKQ